MTMLQHLVTGRHGKSTNKLPVRTALCCHCLGRQGTSDCYYQRNKGIQLSFVLFPKPSVLASGWTLISQSLA